MSIVVQDTKHLVIPPVQGRSTGLVVDRAEGSWFTTTDGEKWLDMVMGIAVVNTGHSHPKVLAAAKAQMDKLVQGQMALFYTEPPMRLAEKLCEIVPGEMDRVLYANSGAETVENAVKLAKQATRRPAVIAFQGAFHGRTHYAMALTANLERAGTPAKRIEAAGACTIDKVGDGFKITSMKLTVRASVPGRSSTPWK